MPGDKFANMVKKAQVTAPGGRGKFGKNLGTPSANVNVPTGSADSGGVVGDGGGSTAVVANPVANSDALRQRLLKRKRGTKERQLQLLQDLDKAEELTLQLLQLAASTTKELASSTDVDGNDEQKERWDKCQANGSEYMQKVKEVHSLLSPHAHYVIAYTNHAVDEEVPEESKGEVESAAKKSTKNEAKLSGAKRKAGGGVVELKKKEKGDKSEKPDEAVEEVLASTKLEAGHTRNMYAARVEKRLAIERRDILQEMLRLEKKKLSS
jgi:hypothetical protein